MDSESDESRGEEISLAEARRPYQISMVANQRMLGGMGEGGAGQQGRCWTKCKRFLWLLCPHLCLAFVTIGYICAVAMVYYWIESENEKTERVKLEMSMEIAQRNFMVQLHNLAPGIPIDKLHKETADFCRETVRLGWTRGRLGVPMSGGEGNGTNDHHQPVWTWANSLLFAFSFISRIGYGHLFPLTSLGKMLLVPFALFGVPLFLVFIADIGKFFADAMNKLYSFWWKFRLRVRRAIREKRRKKQQPNSAGSVVIRNNNTINTNNASIKSKSQERKSQEEEKSNPGAVSLNMNDFSSDDNDGEEEEERPKMPLKFIFPFFLAFWALLALIYRHVEGWAWLDCFYFVFVTMSSIGFGDFAPSSDLSSLLTVCLIIPAFILLVVLTDLGGTEMIRKCHYVATKFTKIRSAVNAKMRRRKRKKRRASRRT